MSVPSAVNATPTTMRMDWFVVCVELRVRGRLERPGVAVRVLRDVKNAVEMQVFV